MQLKTGSYLNAFLTSFKIPSNRLHLGLMLLFILPVWLFDYFPTQDGPAHLANARAMLDYFNFQFPLYQEYYELNRSLTPTWFFHLILAGLISLFSPLVAEKIFLTAYILLFPIAVRYAVMSLRRDAEFLSFFSYAFIYNYLLHLGFYAFCSALLMFFFVFGFWIRHQEHFSIRNTIIFTFLSLLLYLFHISVWTWTFFGIAILSIWYTSLDIFSKTDNSRVNWSYVWNRFTQRALIPLYACLPVICLAAAFLIDKQMINQADIISYADRLQKLLALYSLVSFDSLEIVPVILLSSFFFLFGAWLLITKIKHRKFNHHDGLLIVFVAFVFLYMFSAETILISPNGMTGGGYIDQRLNLFPFFILLLWLAIHHYSPRMSKILVSFAVIVSMTMLTLHSVKYAELNKYIKDYLSASEHISANSTLVALSFQPRGPEINSTAIAKRVELFTHTADYIAANNYVISLTNYEANHGYFPLIFRENRNPYKLLATNNINIELPLEAELDILSYQQDSGGKLDYVLLWGMTEQHLENDKVKSLMKQLKLGYEVVYRSPMELVTLYQSKIR